MKTLLWLIAALAIMLLEGMPLGAQEHVCSNQAQTQEERDRCSHDIEEGVAAFEKGKYDVAYQKVRPWSDAGVPMAQNTLGRMYLTGRGVPQNETQALLLFRQAANQGLPNAKNNLGVMYAAGQGVPQDFQQAVALFLDAANQGFPLAMDNLADMYEKGFGVRPSKEEAWKWRDKAHSGGFTEKKDVMHVTRLGQAEYQKALEFYYQWKFAEAAPFFQQAAEKGHPEAQLILGTLYQYGQGIHKDEEQAKYWTQEAAKQGHTMEDNRDRVLIYSSEEKSKELEKTMRSPTKPPCRCSKDISPAECARRFSCRVP
jgi:TPR repeat protein